MAKRKQDAKDEDDDSGSEASLVNVDFQFQGPNPNVDYHAIKRLLGQLFQRDADLFNLHELSDLILSQPGLGTTIKTDGDDSDPYAILTVLNMHIHKSHPSIKALANYCLQKSSSDPAFHATLQTLFSQSQSHVGFVFCERLINMPVQAIPPLYRLLIEDLRYANDDLQEPFTFSHLLFVSRTYHLTQDEETFLANSKTRQEPTSKRSKKPKNFTTQPSSARPSDGIYSFHPEDEVIKQAALHSIDYTFTNAPKESRDNDSFGLDTRGRIMLVPIERFPEMVARMNEVYTS